MKPGVGIGVIIMKDGKVLIGKRRNAHGDGAWGFPGGHLEFGESWEVCARREVLEETGIEIRNVRFGTVTNDVFEQEGKHYITIFMVADYESGEETIMEPEKCERWEWFEWNQFPQPLFLPIQNLRKAEYNPINPL